MEHLTHLQAIILGIIQGLSEFLPISSSGHLILVRHVLHFPEPGKTFDIIMHLGTLIALIAYFWNDLMNILKNLIKDMKEGKFYGTPDTNLFWFLIISTIPGGLFGALFNEKLEEISNIYLISTLLIIFGIILFAADKMGKKEKVLSGFAWKDAVIVGIAQALALFPGVSRSGITMTSAMFLGFDRETAARYSFLISIPLIGGISAYGILKLIKHGTGDVSLSVYALGLLASVISGFLCIKFLLDFLKKGSFSVFVIYRILIGVLLIFMALSGKIN